MAEEGTVKWFDVGKGYGWIVRERGQDVFVHHTHVLPAGFVLQVGDRVRFDVIEGPKGLQAIDVTKIGTDPSFVTNSLPGGEQKTNTLALVSLGLSLGSLPFLFISVIFSICICVSGLLAIGALITGFMARQQIAVSGEAGDGMALIGIITGGLQIGLVFCIVLFWLVFGLLVAIIQLFPMIASGLQ